MASIAVKGLSDLLVGHLKAHTCKVLAALSLPDIVTALPHLVSYQAVLKIYIAGFSVRDKATHVHV